MIDNTIGFIGAGNMASAMIGGLVPHTIDPGKLFVFDPNQDNCQQLAKQYAVNICASNEELIAHCDVVIIATKPQVMQAVLSPLSAVAKQHKPMIVSIAAGIPCALIQQWLDGEYAIVRVMPNTPALVNAGASGLYANETVSTAQRELAQTLLQAIGSAAWVNNEADIDAVTALSGSGPAYFMLFVQALIQAGTQAGLDEKVAKQLAIDTCAGAAKLMHSSEQSIEQLIKNVTSPGGTTEQALFSFEHNALTTVVSDAFTAARQRSEELAKELS